MKKIVFLLVTVLVMSAYLSGCGGGSGSVGVPEDDGAEYQLKWFAPGNKSTDHELVFSEISKLTKEKINATVTQTLIPSAEYAEQIQRLIFSGEPMDIIYANGFPKYVSDGVYLPLDDLLKTYGQDVLSALPEFAWKAVSVDGKIYGMPPLKDWAVHYVLQYFDGLVKKYNMDFSTVKELKDIEPMLQTVKDNEPGVYPLGVTGKGNGLRNFLPIEQIEGSVIAGFRMNNYDKVVNIYDTDEYKEFFALMRSWNNKGFFRSDAVTGTTVTDLINANKVFLLTSESVPYFQEQKNKIEKEGWKTIFDGRLSKPMIRTKGISITTQTISADSGNPVKAMKLLNLLYKDAELMNMLVLGLEGKHYTTVGDKFYRFPEGVVKTQDNDYYGNPSTQGNRFLLRIKEGEPADLWEQYRRFNDEAVVSDALGFNFDSSKVMNEIAAINNVYQEFIPSLLVGAIDPATELPGILEKFKTAGSEKVVAEIQAQYDAWKQTSK